MATQLNWNFEQYPIDIVYLWVDGNDPEWQKKKALTLGKININKDANDICRFVDNDELKYSLRSVEKYASWINKIFIITDNQIPKWLNLNNPKIKIVDHKEIMPLDALPTYNSCAIETCIINIPNLSEHFLYANDDMFFAAETKPEFFFLKEHHTICRFGQKMRNKPAIHNQIVLNTQKKFREKYGFCIPNKLHHNIDAYTKTDIIECNKLFKHELKKTTYSKLRKSDNIQRIIYQYYACHIGRGHFKSVEKFDRTISLWKNILNFICGNIKKDSIVLFPNKRKFMKKLNKYKPKLFCMNDNEKVTKEDRIATHKFLEEYFPEKSTFEI